MNTSTRPVSVPHLIFGLIFTGMAAIRIIGEATGADLPGSAIGFPIVLIGAGIVGLVATVVNARRRSQAAYETAYEAAYEAAKPDDDLTPTPHTETQWNPTTVTKEEDR